MKIGANISRSKSEMQCLLDLEKNVRKMLKDGIRWAGYQSKVNGLRRPIIELNIARRKWRIGK